MRFEGHLCLILHGHLPFVRHPDRERFYEESWLYEAMIETYLPLIRVLEGWWRDGIEVALTLSLSPTLCAMLRDSLLQRRFDAHLERLIRFTWHERRRTSASPARERIARLYFERWKAMQALYWDSNGDLLRAFRTFEERHQLELMTSSATHALLPLLTSHPSSIRAQVQIACDQHRAYFNRSPSGLWLPECGYTPAIEPYLREAQIRWFVLEGHGLQQARPRPYAGVFAPVFTPRGLAAFGRDPRSVSDVWDRQRGYPGDGRYRDFYRDIGFDRDLDDVKEVLPDGQHRGFTGLKYHRIAEGPSGKALYDPAAALSAVEEHAADFLSARMAQMFDLFGRLSRPPLVVAPFDAELFGHWWFEGPDFLDAFGRKAYREQSVLRLTTPTQYLKEHPTQAVAQPNASSWGPGGYWKLWLDQANHWIRPHLDVAQSRMEELARYFPDDQTLQGRAAKQAGRELLLAQASDWPFLLQTGTAAAYAKRRVVGHMMRFNELWRQLMEKGQVNGDWLTYVESVDNLFPELSTRYWSHPPSS